MLQQLLQPHAGPARQSADCGVSSRHVTAAILFFHSFYLTIKANFCAFLCISFYSVHLTNLGADTLEVDALFWKSTKIYSFEKT
jgi:hypothetical protein